MSNKQKIDLNDFLTSPLRDEETKSFVSNLFNRFLSEEKSIRVNGQIGKTVDSTQAVIAASDLDREMNALTPAIYYATGSEEHIFTFDDLLARMEAIGINTDNLREALAEKNFNFAPPINLDKFINFNNYYWVGKAYTPSLAWNTEVAPEYYVIERPEITSKLKMPVKLATTRDIRLYGKDRTRELIVVEFIDNQTFTVIGNQGTLYAKTSTQAAPAGTNPLVLDSLTAGTVTTVIVYAPDITDPESGGYGVGDSATAMDQLCTFTITSGTTFFDIGDKFEITIEYVTGSSKIGFSGGTSSTKGFLSNIIPDMNLMFIDGMRVTQGDNVLVWKQYNASENGIYTVQNGRWTRRIDMNDESHFPFGSLVYVNEGVTNAGATFSLTARPVDGVFDLDDPVNGQMVWALISSSTQNPVNDWQIGNYWVHRDDLADNEIKIAVQAVRPIIEYSRDIELNIHVDSEGYPSNTGQVYTQAKNRLNQLPQFNLYRYDGTSAKRTSAIFFYVEDPDYPIDTGLQRRLKLTANADYIFGTGIIDESGHLLFYKNTDTSVLKTIWEQGVSEGQASNVTFTSLTPANKGALTIDTVADSVETQTYIITCLTANTFSVVGSRSGNVGTATVDTPFNTGDCTFTITAGAAVFSTGDTFTFSTRGLSAPRYVKKDNGDLVNYPGGAGADISGEGTWLVPRRFFENLPRIFEEEVAYGNLIDHARSIIKSQDGFEGSSFGRNNYRTLESNLGLGGKIREYSSNFPLLVSMLIQRDMSPITLIDFAEQQYQVALSSIDQFIVNELAGFISSRRSMVMSSIDTAHADLVMLLAYFEELRSADENLKSVYSDTTAGVSNWPITLPMMGVTTVTTPAIEFDGELNRYVIRHHDGHVSLLSARNTEFERKLALTQVARSNGTITPGTISSTAPTNPYARQLWYDSGADALKVFNVIDDGENPRDGIDGEFWYRRSTQTVFEWNSSSNSWVNSSVARADLWMIIDTSVIRNSLLLAIEEKLAQTVHPQLEVKVNLDEVAESADAELELAKFAAKYNYDMFAPDYKANDAFTWNYSQATIPDVATHARWFDIYIDYFDQPGNVLPTSRPDLEPWKLMNLSSKPAGWDDSYADTTSTRLWNDAMWSDIQAARPGLKLCVDTTTDQLLPPYVSSTSVNEANKANALLNERPDGIDENYGFGDNGPVESVWKRSLEYRYGLARALFKRDPLNFLDAIWGETYVSSDADEIRLERNLVSPLAPSKFLLHGEKLHNVYSREVADHFIGGNYVIAEGDSVEFVCAHVENYITFFYAYVNGELIGSITEDMPFAFTSGSTSFTGVAIIDAGIPFSLGDSFTFNASGSTFTPTKVKKLVGLGQTFSNLLRHNNFDSASDATNAYRGWAVHLAHRVGTLIRGDSLTIAAANIAKLPETAYSLKIKRSTSNDSKWISALRVQLVKIGTYTTTKSGAIIPFGDGSDWVFRVETYNNQHPLIEYYTFDTTGDYQTFHALNKRSTSLAFKRYTTRTGLVSVTSPMLVEGGLQDTLNVLFGYIDRLNDLGWAFNAGERIITDDETGRNVDWQLEIEKLVDRCYRGFNVGEGQILNPFMQSVWLNTPVGLMSRYTDRHFIDAASAQAVFDVTGSAIPVKNLQVIRTDDATVTYSETPMFSAHAFVDEFEHIILFNNHVSDEEDSASLFNPFLGLYIDTATLSYTRQEIADRKPRFDGFVLSGNDVTRNIVSSIDAIASYYDASKTFNEPSTSSHALALLGFNKKNYFNNLGASDATQFNFWRGLIQAKGTNNSISAFVNYKKFTSGTVDEYWAYKLAEYGDNRVRVSPEIKVEVADALQHFTQLQFYNANDTGYTPLPLFTQIEKDDDARWFSIDDLSKDLKFPAQQIETVIDDITPRFVPLADIYHNGDDAEPTVYLRTITKDSFGEVISTIDTPTALASMVNSQLLRIDDVPTPATNMAFKFVVKGYTWKNQTKLSPVKLFNYKDNTLDADIGLWHPAIGLHAYEPLDLINTISNRDPALYNQTIQTTSNPNYVVVKPWGKREVGRVWWDTSSLGYIPYYDASVFPDRNERHARWGSLADWASINVYEWIESDVPPEEYDELAATEEGNADIDASVRMSGRAALKKYYSRNRAITMRPIAWSRAGVNNAGGHPAFGPAYMQKAIVTGEAIYLDYGRTDETGLTIGRRFGGWKDNKPDGEVIIGSDLVFDLGSSTALGSPESARSGNIESITVTPVPNGRLGNYIGQITLSSRLEQLNTYDYVQKLRMSDSSGSYEDIEIIDWKHESEDDITFRFADFGIDITITRVDSTANYTAQEIVEDILQSWLDVYVREGVRYTDVISLPRSEYFPQEPLVLGNDEDEDEDDPHSLPHAHDWGWRCWDVPTQDELDADLLFPRNKWQPYLGDEIEVSAGSDIIAEMEKDMLILRNGIKISRYSSTWTDWEELSDVKITKIADGSTYVSFDRSDIIDEDEVFNALRISIYVNGLQLSPKNYVVNGVAGAETIDLIEVPPSGAQVLLIYRAYAPTDAELKFDSSVEDDPTIQTEYKETYQYSKVDIRGETGAIIGSKYYFWIQDSTVVRPGKSMSLAQAKSILKSGPSEFVLFGRLNPEDNAFDSCVIAGLNRFITDNNTYKLRFMLNETLRDDPEGISLKNVHTEWVLLRPSQNAKIPEQLWKQLTDAAAGQDAGGNPLPSRARVDYDARNGTRTSYGFGAGQILADTELVRATIKNTILNTSLVLRVGSSVQPDYITALNFDDADEWFADAVSARATMDLIWSSARAKQINEIFFAVLEDALANNYEFTDIFKTSFIAVQTTSSISEMSEAEIEDGIF